MAFQNSLKHISFILKIMKIAYLFSFKNWKYQQEKYILVYAENEEEARKIGCKNCYYNNGEKASPKDLIIQTYGL